MLVVRGATVATTMETMPTEEVATQVTTVAMGASLQATMAIVEMEAMLMVVSSLDSVIPHHWVCLNKRATADALHLLQRMALSLNHNHAHSHAASVADSDLGNLLGVIL